MVGGLTMQSHAALLELIEDLNDRVKELIERVVAQQHTLTELAETADSPTGTLSFPLPQNESQLRVAMNGSKYLNVLYTLNQWCRNVLKYDMKNEAMVRWGGPREDFFIYLEDLQTKIRGLMEDEGVSLDDGE
jgi:hypothetical protein